jgi:L-asparaginase II
VRARPELDDALIAIACASHGASDEQVAAVRALLAGSGSSEDDLENGPQEGKPPGRIYHNCSGKHAGMLAVCRARGLPLPGYRLPEHPLQQELRAEIEDVAGARAPTAADGCGVVTFAFPLRAMARSFASLAGLDGGPRVLAAMQAHPEMLRGPVGTDVALMEARPGWLAKGGAEGLMCARSPEGVGVALKVEDGAYRAIGPALGAFLPLLGQELDGFARVPLSNSVGDVVGEVTAG